MPSCSFCSNPSHNIRNCDSHLIQYYYTNINQQYIDCLALNTINPLLIFTTTVSRIYNLPTIKAVSVKYTNSNAYLNKNQHIFRLFQHFTLLPNTIYTHNPLQNYSNNNNLLPNTPDQLPSYAQDLNTNYEEPEDIHWYIDRTPNSNFVIPISQRIYISLDLLNEYIEASDDYIPIPRNLNNEFDSTSKKYSIMPILTVDNNTDNELEDCPICYEQFGSNDSVRLNCNHRFCGSCILSTLSHHRFKDGSPGCALCRQNITTIMTKNNETFNNICEFCIL
jgi:hypothetical protein